MNIKVCDLCGNRIAIFTKCYNFSLEKANQASTGRFHNADVCEQCYGKIVQTVNTIQAERDE